MGTYIKEGWRRIGKREAGESVFPSCYRVKQDVKSHHIIYKLMSVEKRVLQVLSLGSVVG